MKMSASGPDRSSNAFGAQSLSAGLSKNIAASGGLGNTAATPVGRPTTDLSRVAGMMSRGTARPGQLQAAQLMHQQRGVAAIEDYFNRQDIPPPATPLATAAGTMGVAVAPMPSLIMPADASVAAGFGGAQPQGSNAATGNPPPQGIGGAMGGSVVPPMAPPSVAPLAPSKKKPTGLEGSWGELPPYNPLGNAANQMGINPFSPTY